MTLLVPLEPPPKENLHISVHYLVIIAKYIQFNSTLNSHFCITALSCLFLCFALPSNKQNFTNLVTFSFSKLIFGARKNMQVFFIIIFLQSLISHFCLFSTALHTSRNHFCLCSHQLLVEIFLMTGRAYGTSLDDSDESEVEEMDRSASPVTAPSHPTPPSVPPAMAPAQVGASFEPPPYSPWRFYNLPPAWTFYSIKLTFIQHKTMIDVFHTICRSLCSITSHCCAFLFGSTNVNSMVLRSMIPSLLLFFLCMQNLQIHVMVIHLIFWEINFFELKMKGDWNAEWRFSECNFWDLGSLFESVQMVEISKQFKLYSWECLYTYMVPADCVQCKLEPWNRLLDVCWLHAFIGTCQVTSDHYRF